MAVHDFMQNENKKQWYLGALFLLITVFSSLGWDVVARAISDPEMIGWSTPIFWFSIAISMMCLSAFSSARGVLVPMIAAILVFIPGVMFVQNLFFVLVLIVGIGLSISGLLHMRDDLDSRLHISIRRSMQHGIGWIVFSLSLVITCFYYVQIQRASADELLQRLSLDRTSHVMLTQALGMMNPEFKKANQESVTVDEFLLTLQKNQVFDGDMVTSMPSDAELLQSAGVMPNDPKAPQVLGKIKDGLAKNVSMLDPQRIFLEQGRARLSSIAGVPLSGQENITDVLSQIIDHRVRTYFQPDMLDGHATILPFVLSVILFLTLWSLGSILGIVWRMLTAVMFALLSRFDVIMIKKISVEQEVVG